MKLLIITPRIPDLLDKGDKLRIFHQIKFLSNFHKIDLICLEKKKNTKLEIEKYIQNLYTIEISNLERVFNILYYTIIKGKPIQVSYYYSKKAHGKIDYLIKKSNPDWLYCQLIRSSEYIKSYKHKKVIDYMDSFSLGLRRRKSVSKGLMSFLIQFEYNRVRKYEKNIFNYFNSHTIISNFDRKSINHLKNKEILVVPNGIDTNYFSKKNRLKNKNIILFVGNMSYPPNIIAAKFICEKVFPIMNNKNQDFKIMIAGSNPSKEVKNLQKIDSKIQITGFIKDIRDVYTKASIFIAPMFIGSGLQNKLLEAMSMKIPCITTGLANNSLKATEKEIIIANNEYEFANECLELLNNSKKRFELGKNGHNFVKKNFSWEESTDKINKLFT